MLAEITRGDDFGGLHLYLTGVAKQLGPDDIEIRNLVSHETAVAEMQAVARRSKRIERPVYHLIVTWHEDEQPTPAQQFEMSHELIERIGLGEHQALLVRHHEVKGGATPGQGRHYELHVLVNRVGPDGRAATMSHDYAVVENAVADIARAWSMRPVPGRFNGVGEQNFRGASNAAISFTAATGIETVAGEIRSSPDTMKMLIEARKQGWPALLEAFRTIGVTVTHSNRTIRAGQTAGLVLVYEADPKRKEKISALDGNGIKWGLPALERELGPLPPLQQGGPANEFTEPAASVSQTHAPHRRASHRAYDSARTDAIRRRQEVGTTHATAKTKLRQSHKARCQHVLLARTQRRSRLIQFFGRGSPIGAALNRALDINSAERLRTIRAAQAAEVTALEATHRSEMDRVIVPRWQDWQRARDDGAEQGVMKSTEPQLGHSPEPTAPSQRLRAPDPEPDDVAAKLAARRALEEQRRDRLRRNRDKNRARRARVSGFGRSEQPSVSVAAHLIRSLAEGRISLRMAVMTIVVLAATNGLAPLLLAMAAVDLVSDGLKSLDRARMQADVNAEKAAKAGFAFMAVPKADRIHYARLAKSALFTAAGSEPGPIIAKLSVAQAASFVAWYTHTSDRQRLVVQGWEKPPADKRRQTQRPAKNKAAGGRER